MKDHLTFKTTISQNKMAIFQEDDYCVKLER